jgi:hypothetical protein
MRSCSTNSIRSLSKGNSSISKLDTGKSAAACAEVSEHSKPLIVVAATALAEVLAAWAAATASTA